MSKTKTLKVPESGFLRGNAVPKNPGTYRVVLNKDQSAWHPGSTKYNIHGPGVVTYTIYSDGGCSYEKEGCSERPIPGTSG